MTLEERTMRGLECCVVGDCNNCPYFDEGTAEGACDKLMHKEIIGMLRMIDVDRKERVYTECDVVYFVLEAVNDVMDTYKEDHQVAFGAQGVEHRIVTRLLHEKQTRNRRA